MYSYFCSCCKVLRLLVFDLTCPIPHSRIWSGLLHTRSTAQGATFNHIPPFSMWSNKTLHSDKRAEEGRNPDPDHASMM